MAMTSEAAETRTPRKRTASRTTPRKAAATRRAPRATRKRVATTPRTDVGELELLIRALDRRITELTSSQNIRSTISGASDQVGKVMTTATSQVGDMAADLLTDVAGRLRHSAGSVTGVAKSGLGAVQKIGSELERRPLMSVAIALGIGFLAGLAGRKSDPS